MLNDSSKKYGPIAAIAVTVGSYFGAYLGYFFIAGIALSAWVAIKGGTVENLANEVERSVGGQFITSLLVYSFTAVIVLYFMRRKKITLKDVGLGRLVRYSDAGLALLTFGIYFVVLAIIMAIVAVYVPTVNLEQQQQLTFEKTTSGLSLFPVFIALAVLPPVVEEFVMRGFLFTGLRNKLSIWPAALITSFLFSIAHLQLGAGSPPLYVAAIDTFVLSMFLVHLRVRTNSIWAGILVHMLKNSLAFAALFIFKVS